MVAEAGPAVKVGSPIAGGDEFIKSDLGWRSVSACGKALFGVSFGSAFA